MTGVDLSSAALGPTVGILPVRRKIAVGFGHIPLQTLFKQLICGLGFGRRGGSGADRPILGRCVILPTGCVIAEIAALSGGVFALRLGLKTLDGQIDFATIQTDDHNLYILTFGQMLADIADIAAGYLRNMYHTGLVIIPRDKCAKIGDCFYLAL